jgi:hypothetical protein
MLRNFLKSDIYFRVAAVATLLSKKFAAIGDGGRSTDQFTFHILFISIMFSCPVCRYVQTPEVIDGQSCFECGSQEVRELKLLSTLFLHVFIRIFGFV